MTSNTFQLPMQSWPGLESYAREIQLPRSKIPLFLYEAGREDYPPICLIHGIGDEADTWRHLIPALASRWRVIAPDLPGFGRSGLPARSLTIPFFQEIILEMMDELGLSHVTLCGHSMGGVIAHALTLDHPQRVERLVLLSGCLVARVTGLNLATLLFLVPGLGEWQYNRLRRDPQAAYRSLKTYYRNLDGLPETDRSFLFQRVNQRVWSDKQRQAFFSALRSLAQWVPAQQRSLPARLANFQVPTQVVWGEADQVNAIANGHALIELQPTARLAALPEAGHNLHQENPAAILQAIDESPQA